MKDEDLVETTSLYRRAYVQREKQRDAADLRRQEPLL